MIKRNQILIYGLEEDERARLNKVFNTFEFSSIQFRNKYNLLSNNHFLVCMNLDKLDEEEYKSLIQYFENAEGNLVEYRLFTNNRFELSKYKNVKLYNSFNHYERTIHDDIKDILRNLKLIENKVSNFVKLCTLLTLFKQNPIISTESLIQLTGYKNLEIRRYIEVLRIMGEPLQYDFELNSWNYKDE